MTTTTVKTNEQVVLDYMNQAWNQKDVSAIDDAFTKDAIIHSAIRTVSGPEAMKEVVSYWINAFPDVRVTMLKVASSDDTVMVHWESTGTHKGELKGVEPTETTATYKGVTIHRLEEGKVVEYWAYVDMREWFESIKDQAPCMQSK